jgi:orotate phosphoribosyltransferase-like protein
MAFKADGTPDPVMHDEPEVTEQRHTPDLARKAYDLRDRGLSLNDVATACQVPRGSVVYLITKGHELYLASHGRTLNHD